MPTVRLHSTMNDSFQDICSLNELSCRKRKDSFSCRTSFLLTLLRHPERGFSLQSGCFQEFFKAGIEGDAVVCTGYAHIVVAVEIRFAGHNQLA